MKKLMTVLAALAIASLTLAACGGDDDNETTGAATTGTTQTQPAGGGGGGGGGGGVTTDKLSADPSGALKFDTDKLDAKTGKVTIDFTNPAPIQHDVVLEQDSQELGRTDLISDGDTDSFTVTLKPGTYTYFCSVPGHRESGMEGTLTVK
jgi:plastocyanin